MHRLLRDALQRQAAPRSIKRAVLAPVRRERTLAERWPPGWGLLGACGVSALMWWSILHTLGALVAVLFMS